MSLYESLSRVLAPFASRLNGLLTGYDGTTYSSPAEAVRTQISDLHVLIGDIQGDAKISGSAVRYEGDLSATTMQGAVDELSGDVTNVNGRLQQQQTDIETVESDVYGRASVSISTNSKKIWEDNEGTAQMVDAGNSWFASNAVDVVEGEKYVMYTNIRTGYSTSPYFVTDDNMNIIETGDDISGQGPMYVSVTIPTGGTKLLINKYATQMALYKIVSKIPVIDDTLANEGEAADSKATGDALSALGTEIQPIKTDNQTIKALLVEDVTIPATSDGRGWWETSNDIATEVLDSSTTTFFAIAPIPVEKGEKYRVWMKVRTLHSPLILAKLVNNQYQVIEEYVATETAEVTYNLQITDDDCYLLITRYGTAGYLIVTHVDAFMDVVSRNFVNSELAAIEAKIPFKGCTPFASAGLTWDWWYSASAVDMYGTAYIGFIDENSKCGVMMRKSDGTIAYKYLDTANNNDDHNPMGVCIDSTGHVYAFGTLGHSYANKIAIYKAQNPYTIDCEFDNLSVELNQPTGATYKCTYGQAFVYKTGNTEYITDFFRVVSTDAGVCYAALQSTDGGATWTLHGVTKYSDPYIKFVDKGGGRLALVCTSNPIAGNRTIYLGELDVVTGAIYSGGTQIATWSTIQNGTGEGTATVEISASCPVNARNDFAAYITASYRFRLLDARYINSKVYVLWALADTDFTDWTYYLFDGTESVSLGKSGTPFYLYSGYLPGCCFVDDNYIAVCRNVSAVQDGKHALFIYEIGNDTPTKKGVFESLSCRPIPCGNGIVAVSCGIYNDTSTTETVGTFTAWHLAPAFRSIF